MHTSFLVHEFYTALMSIEHLQELYVFDPWGLLHDSTNIISTILQIISYKLLVLINVLINMPQE